MRSGKLGKILKGSLESIPSLLLSAIIQIMVFALGVKAKHCWALSTNFWKQKVCWHRPVLKIFYFKEPVKRRTEQDESEGVDSANEESGQQEKDQKKLLPASHYIGEKYMWEMTEKVDAQIK